MPSPVIQLPRHRMSYVTPTLSRRASPSEKSRASSLLLVGWLVAPFVVVMLWGFDLQAKVVKDGNGARWLQRVTVTDTRAANMHAFGGEESDVRERRKGKRETEMRGVNVEPGRKVVDGDDVEEAEAERGNGSEGLLDGRVAGGDFNGATKRARVADRFRPRSLPQGHRNGELLERIRGMGEMWPRWAKYDRMKVQELKSYGPAFSSIIISDKLKVIYVPVFKVGTTSMMWHIAYLENNRYVLDNLMRSPKGRDHFLHDMSGPGWRNESVCAKKEEEIRRCFEDPEYLKFGFVRNPFDRVISAYLDKVVQFEPEHKEYQKQMYSLYGNDVEMRRLRNESKPSFREYLEAIEVVLREPRTKNCDLRSKEAYEGNKSRRDLHWRPQVELLHPDLIHFDFVGRFERLEEDREVVLEWMYRHTDRRIAKEGRKKLHATNPEDKRILMDELRRDEQLRQMVLRIYKDDFDRFRFERKVPQ